MNKKCCIQCEESKPLGEFYANSTMRDGRASACKECHKKRMYLRRLTNPQVGEYDRERSKHAERRAVNAANSKRWREQNPDAYKAQTAVSNAVRDGRLKKEPCAICSSTENLHAHYRDYSKPLDVIWLCARCHHRLHALFPELEGLNKRMTCEAAE